MAERLPTSDGRAELTVADYTNASGRPLLALIKTGQARVRALHDVPT